MWTANELKQAISRYALTEDLPVEEFVEIATHIDEVYEALKNVREERDLWSRDVLPIAENCAVCDGGVIETGNNDLPCECPAGDTAIFNVTGVEGPISGALVKQRHARGQ
jgi:hypothetical protein